MMICYQHSKSSENDIVTPLANSYRASKEDGISLYKFPGNDRIKIRKRWIHVLGMKEVPSTAMACSVHFEDTNYKSPKCSKL